MAMKSEETIGIVIPVYNTENYLDDIFYSLIKQTYQFIKIIFVNDGSTDKSLSKLNEFKNKDSRVIVIDNNHNGVSNARNTGIEYCLNDKSIKSITFVDSDDILEKDYIETLQNCKNKYNTKISCCMLRKLDGNKDIGSYKTFLYDKKEVLRFYFEDKVFFESPCMKLIDIDHIKDIRFKENKHFEDTFICYKLIEKTEKISYVDYYGYNNRRRAGSAIRSAFSDFNYDKVEACLEIYNYYKNSEFEVLAYNKYMGSLFYFILKSNENSKNISKNKVAIQEVNDLVKLNGFKNAKKTFYPLIIATKIGIIGIIKYRWIDNLVNKIYKK